MCAGRPGVGNQACLRWLTEDELADLAFLVWLSEDAAAALPFLPRWASVDAATDLPLMEADVDSRRPAELTIDARRSFATDGCTTRDAFVALDITRLAICQF